MHFSTAPESESQLQEATSAAGEWVTAKEVAQTFAVTVATVGDWRRRGLVPAVRVSRRVVRYKLDDVRAAFERIGGQGVTK